MRNFTILRVWGIPIRINVSLLVFLPILAWLIGSGGQIEVYSGWIEGITGVALDVAALRAGATPWVIGVAAAVGLFVSVTLHELGHSWVALRYGVEIESITLWILGGIASLKSIPKEWNREFWIAIAGPVVSALVGGIFYVALFAVPESLPVVRFVVGWLAIANLTLVVFNLLPAFPMDGGRILRALLARSRPYASATRIAGRIGVIFAILFAVVGVLTFQLLLLLLAFFIYTAATTESRTVLIDELLEGLTVGDVMDRNADGVAPDTSVADLLDRMVSDRRSVYPVVDDGEVVGVVALSDLRGVRGDRSSTTVASVMREAPRIGSDADAFEVLARYGTTGDFVAVVEDGPDVVGTVSAADYSRALTMQREFRSGVRW